MKRTTPYSQWFKRNISAAALFIFLCAFTMAELLCKRFVIRQGIVLGPFVKTIRWSTNVQFWMHIIHQLIFDGRVISFLFYFFFLGGGGGGEITALSNIDLCYYITRLTDTTPCLREACRKNSVTSLPRPQLKKHVPTPKPKLPLPSPYPL